MYSFCLHRISLKDKRGGFSFNINKLKITLCAKCVNLITPGVRQQSK